MKYIKFLLVGVIFGIVLSKAEIVSWYRIYEMFKFQSFHMYGVIGSAVVLGIITKLIIKKVKLQSIEGDEIITNPKDMSIPRYLIGGTLFGLGWAMTGACPGPMFIVIGQGVWAMGIVILSATFGTFVYGLIRHKLPH
ncbi:MAG: YeeE/YedE family protein [Cytophagales bacterium]|nr:YeeE/YedE family protein [Cytophagales bacterium]